MADGYFVTEDNMDIEIDRVNEDMIRISYERSGISNTLILHDKDRKKLIKHLEEV